MLSGAFAGKQKLLIGTQENLLICNLEKDSVSVSSTVEGFDYSGITAILQTGDSSDFVIGTDGNGLFKLHLSERGNTLGRLKNLSGFESLSVQSIIIDSEKNLLVSTFGLACCRLFFQMIMRQSVPSANITRAQVWQRIMFKTVFQDKEGNFWIGTYFEGLSMLTSYAIGFYQPGEDAVRNNILFVGSYEGKYLLGTPEGFHIFDAFTGKSVAFTDLTRLVANTEITSYFLEEDNLWIGTGGGGLYLRNKSGAVKRFYRSGDSGSDFIKDIEIENQ